MMQFKKQLMLIPALILLLSLPALAENPHAEYIKGPFETGPDVTKVCLECHEKETNDFMKTSHWTWSLEQKIGGKTVTAGKRNTFNNYCTQIVTNEPSCNKGHAGYGYMDEYLICRMYADARVARIYAGTSEIMLEVSARGL